PDRAVSIARRRSQARPRRWLPLVTTPTVTRRLRAQEEAWFLPRQQVPTHACCTTAPAIP
ncbi:MAG: hypothetical protein ACXWJE_12880, partial [Burkholderiaceae bacterium]